jgi:hypothetical protein
LRARLRTEDVSAMNVQLFKLVIIFCFCVVVTCSHSYAFRGFPTEAKVNANLRSDMTTDQVVALFGKPFNGRPDRCINCHFLYLVPSGMRTADREGYQGFEVQFDEGKVRNWRIFTGRPSYDPVAVGPPRAFKWWLISWPLMFIVAFIIAFVRGIPLAMNQRARMLRAFVGMKIPPKLPPEFAFITHDTTLREILERVGPCTGEVEFCRVQRRSPQLSTYSNQKGRLWHPCFCI